MGQCAGCHRGQHLTVMMMPFICSCRNKKYTFLQMTYTAENPHADDSFAPGARPQFHPPLRRYPHNTSPAPTTTGWREDRCPVVSKLPHPQSCCSKDVTVHPHLPGARPGSPCPVPDCSGQPQSDQRRFIPPLRNRRSSKDPVNCCALVATTRT